MECLGMADMAYFVSLLGDSATVAGKSVLIHTTDGNIVVWSWVEKMAMFCRGLQGVSS